MTNREPWDRLLWAVQFTGVDRARPFFVGSTWWKENNIANKGYPDEPGRLLLFRTRAKARVVCREFRAGAKETGGISARWLFTPVRVRERVTAA